MKPKEKGDLAVAYAIFYFQTKGYEVCLPIGDKRPYDLIIERDGILSKVQVKFTGHRGTSNKHKAALRTMGGNQSYNSAKKYGNNDFELLFVHTANGKSFLIPWVSITNRNSLTVDASKYAEYEVKYFL